MKFETQQDLDRETRAIQLFSKAYKLEYKKLGGWDIDFVMLRNGKQITHAEVKGRLKDAADSFPLPLAIRKAYKLNEASKDPVIIWACNDGILYAKLNELKGEIKQGGRKQRKGSTNDVELMAYYPNQEGMRFLKYEI